MLAGLGLCFFRKSFRSPCSFRFFLRDFFLTRGTLWHSICKQVVWRRQSTEARSLLVGCRGSLRRKRKLVQEGKKEGVTKRGDASLFGTLSQRG